MKNSILIKMKKKLLPIVLFAMSASVLFVSCSNDDDETTLSDNSLDRDDVVSNYSAIVLKNYQDAQADAQALKTAINTLTSNPTQAAFEEAKQAWLTARESYGPSEAYRFTNGPIDSGDTEEIEGLLNSWPLDEAYVDYVDGNANSGIINNPTDFPTLTKETLASQNGEGGEENVSIGYHAIEFLLWGQDLTNPDSNQPGLRPFTDFVDGGTANNADRRRLYLNLCAELVIDHLQVIINEWSGPYKEKFLAQDTNTTLTELINGIAELSRSELAIERMAVALQNQDQEDEHSCFSDNTHRDIRLNLIGIVNVFRGSYGTINGRSLKEIIEEADSALALELDNLLTEAQSKVEATAVPFDLAISGGASSAEGAKVQEAVQSLVAFGDKLLETKVALGL